MMKWQGNDHEIFKNDFQQNLVKEETVKWQLFVVVRVYVNSHKDVNTHVNLCL